MNKVKDDNNPSKFYRVYFVLRYLFFGFLIWSYYRTMFEISRMGIIGGIVGLVALVMFFINKRYINPIKDNHMEFGKNTDDIGMLISVFALFCLAILFGMGY